MSAILASRDLTKSHAGRLLFEDLTLAIHAGERVGMIGPNGAGKSTLLRVLAGIEEPDAGQVSLQKGARLAFMAQEEAFPPERTCLELTCEAAGAGLEPLERETRARIVLGKLGFEDPDQPAGQLSGGWRKRLAMARALVTEPDLLLLDEPTNHLDLEGIEALERTLASGSFASLVITHDRAFLQGVANQIVEIGRHYPGGFLRVEGGYEDFLRRREELLSSQAKQEQSLANTVRRELEWLSRGPRGRGTKSKDRIKQAHETMEELAEVRARNRSGGAAQIGFSASGRKTQDLLRTQGLAVARGGRTLVKDLELALGPGERLGLVGDNGSGKSTLLSTLAGERAPDAGAVAPAKHLRVVVFHQQRERLDPEATLRETLCAEGDTVTYRGQSMHVTAWAKRFRFEPDQLMTKVGALSGGERARLLIADLVRQPADLLLLDEPTNDLDLPTLQVLEESLLDFPGALVLVTHDRAMLETVCTGLLYLDGEGGAHPLADLDQVRRLRERLRRAGKPEKAPAREAPSGDRAPPRTQKRSYKEEREWEGMEGRIHAAEERAASLQAAVEDPEVLSDHRRLEEAYADLHAAQAQVDALYARWEELEAKGGG